MSKIKLGNRPESFKPFPVKFIMPDGEDGVITSTYKYRTRNEWAAYRETMLNDAKKQAVEKQESSADEEDKDVGFLQQFVKSSDEAKVCYLLGAMTKWDLDIPLNKESLLQLVNEIPACGEALALSYDAACRDGRLGN